jgi:5-carboxymethyl-2-hydroxymuconic-semialdehyde dehydrogenase
MDKMTPKDVFQANRDRAAPLLEKLKADGIGHLIDGKIVPSISGATFETKSPVDGAVLASVAFDGMKSSGIGRDGGDYSFDFYMETKHVSLARGTHRIQRLGL